jgi:Flp pilus assembly protein TadG
MRSRSFIHRLAPRHSAQAVVEFALILPVMLIMVLGSLDLGRALVFGVAVQDGAREAARLGSTGSATDVDVLNRLIAASAPAVGGCAANLTAQSCGGGTWTFSLKIETPNGIADCFDSACPVAHQAKTVCPLPTCLLGGSKLTVTARGQVSMFQGFSVGGMQLFQIGAQGQTAMVMV